MNIKKLTITASFTLFIRSLYSNAVNVKWFAKSHQLESFNFTTNILSALGYTNISGAQDLVAVHKHSYILIDGDTSKFSFSEYLIALIT
jgi:hypothetical protein